MYRPKHFDCTDAAMLGRITTAHPFAVLVTTLDGRLDATHLPVLADHARGAHGVLRFHLAAANPAARALDGTVEA